MMRRIHSLAVLAAVAAASGTPLRADVQTQEKTHVQFAGALGRMVNMFGGKAAKEGIVQTVAVKGDRMMTTNDRTAELIDLAEEKVYNIDLDSKSYKVVTFAEIRQKMQEEQAKAKEHMDAAKEKQEKEKPEEPQKKMAVDVSTKETGQKKTVNGFDCKEVVTTVTMREDGKTLEQGGGMVMTTDAWMTAPIPAMKEVAAFRKRYFEKLYGMDMQAAAMQMAQAFAMYPQMKDLMSRSRVEGSKVDGTSISTVSTVESVPSPEQKQQQAEQDKHQDSGGGLSGMLARKMMKKKSDDSAASSDSSRSQLMTSTMEVLSVATSVSQDAVSVPAGFKLKN
jgi:hypothetical protein